MRDRSWGDQPAYLEFTARRFKCRHCRCPFTAVVEAIASSARMTRRYAHALVGVCSESSLQTVARREHLGYKAVEGAYYRAATAHCPALPARPIQRLGIDELATQKGRAPYRLVLSDLDARGVVAVLPDRRQATLEAYLAEWSPEGRAAVQEVAMDFWLPYHQAVRAQLPQARITADRFHGMHNLLDRFAEARRSLQRTWPAAQRRQLKGQATLLNRNAADLTPAEHARLQTLKEAVPELGPLHDLKEQFRAIFAQAPERADAAQRLQEWVDRVQATGNEPLGKFLTTLQNWGRHPELLRQSCEQWAGRRVEQ